MKTPQFSSALLLVILSFAEMDVASARTPNSSFQPKVVTQRVQDFVDGGIAWTGPEWQALDAKDKQAIVWAEINQQSMTASQWPQGNEFEPLFQRSMHDTFIRGTDQMPPGRTKLTHTQGAVATVRFIPQNTDKHTFSGLFRTGADYGIIRYSDVFAPNKRYPKTQAGCALKFFRDGMHSGNTVMMVDFNPEPSHNFLKDDFCSIVTPPKNRCVQETLATKLATVDRLFMGNSSLDLARHHADSAYGSTSDGAVNQPFRLRLEQEPHLRDAFPDSFIMEGNEQILSLNIQPGSRLGKIWCLENPAERPQDEVEIHCGDLVTTSYFTTSVVADQKLFFAHEVMKEDCELKPQWEPFLPKWDGRLFTTAADLPSSEIKAMKSEELRMELQQDKDWNCPFSFLFNH